MSDLNKKNINYGALNRFYQDLKSHDLSGLATEQYVDDAIDNIEFPEYVAGEGIDIDSANTISCTVKPINDVSALPDADENKDSVLRLEGDEQVYISKTTPIGTTDRLPEEQQIGVGRFCDSGGALGYYQGQYIVRCTDGDLQGYLWTAENNGEVYDAVITNDGAETIVLDENTSAFFLRMGDLGTDYVVSIDNVNKIISVDLTKAGVLNTEDNIEYKCVLIPATYNAPNSEQVGKAYLKLVEIGDARIQPTYFYTDTSVNVNGVNYYIWAKPYNDGTNLKLATTVPANEIYKYPVNPETPYAYAPTCNVYTYNSSNNTITNSVPSGYMLGGRSELIGGVETDVEGVYIAPLTLSDSEQIDNAYMAEYERNPYTNNSPSDSFYIGVYKGEAELTGSNGTFNLYAWYNSSNGNYTFTNTNAINTTQQSLEYIVSSTKHIVKVDDTHYELRNNSDNTLAAIEDNGYLYNDMYVVVQKSYERILFGYEWQRVVTEDELYPNETTFTGATLTVDGSQPSIVASGSTTIVWDNLAASIPSGKTVEVIVVAINTTNSARQITMSGNYQIMGDGNITIQPNELGLYRGTYISVISKWLVEAVNQEVQGMVS